LAFLVLLYREIQLLIIFLTSFSSFFCF